MSVAKWYAAGAGLLLTKVLDWENDDIYVAFLSTSYTPNIDLDEVWDDVSTYEITGINYTAGGQLLVNCTQTYQSTGNTWKLDCDNPLWANATFTGMRYAVFYRGTTEDLICYIDFGGSNSVTAQNAMIDIHASGLAALVLV